VDLEFNVDTLRIADLGDEEDNNNTSSGSALNQSDRTNSVLSSIKRTSVVTTASMDADMTLPRKPNPKPQDAAPKIRSMLQTLNPERD